MRGRHWLVVLVIVAASAVGGVTGAAHALEQERSVSEIGGRIVYCKARAANTYECTREIYVADGDGTNARRIATLPFAPEGFQWSPAGDRFLFNGPTSGPREGLYLGTVGGTVKRLTTSSSGGDWSADGRSLAYGTRDGSLIVLRGAVSRVLVRGIPSRGCTFSAPLKEAVGPRFSPDGKEILYGFTEVTPRTCSGRRAAGMARIDLRTATRKVLTKFPLTSVRNASFPLGWAPDGTRLLYSIGSHTAMTMRRDGGGRVKLSGSLTAFPSNNDRPWSPDGRWVNLGISDGYTVEPGVVEVKTRLIKIIPGEPVGWSRSSDLLVVVPDEDGYSGRLVLLSGDTMTEIATADASRITQLDWTG